MVPGMFPQPFVSPQANATAAQITAAATRGAQPSSSLTLREWLVGQALMGLSAVPGLRMEECAAAAQRGADAALIQLQMIAPPQPVATTPTTTTTTAATAGK